MPEFDWFYDEVRQVGTDFTDYDQVMQYDSNMGDRSAEIQKLIHIMKLDNTQTVLEIGTGTGSIAVGVAPSCKQVYAIDVSKPMLDYAAKKARDHKVDNIIFHQAGFLSYRHLGYPVTRIFSHYALHHLPDFWKSIALLKMYDQLEAGGMLYIQDVVFSFPVRNYKASIDFWIENLRAGSTFDEAELCTHIRDEYSTFGWILEGMLRDVGFHIVKAEYSGYMYATYLCEKEG
ncbi:class I SAM-dependent methyltransferase [Paenibacillus alkalitolerans]|uniref:class I SAM-dependent methyltransferase n=1 Tax=Paenibacillus alkalitolerans TaxID=2799335 RepID=UPI0018F621BB|nr:class I SAM-dependent methyltransferase [Paenibacillus alkalitolerans]